MGIVAWVLIGAALGVIFASNQRFSFPGGRPACILGGVAGGFLGGGILSAATRASQTGIQASSLGAAGAGALLVIAAVRWAARTDSPESSSRNGRNLSGR